MVIEKNKKNGSIPLLLNSHDLSSDSYIFEGPESEKSERSGPSSRNTPKVAGPIRLFKNPKVPKNYSDDKLYEIGIFTV